MQTFTLPLPSGKQVEMRYPDLPQLVIDGEVPDVLSGDVQILIDRTLDRMGIASAAERKHANEDLAEGEQAVQLMRFIVRQATVMPVIYGDLEDGKRLKAAGYMIDHISHYDLMDLYGMFFAALGVAGDLEALFREPEGAADDLAAVSHGQDDGADRSDTTERADEPTMEPLSGGPGGEPVGAVRRGKTQRARRSGNPEVDARADSQSRRRTQQPRG